MMAGGGGGGWGAVNLYEMNQHTRELISAQKTSHKHNNKDLSRLQ